MKVNHRTIYSYIGTSFVKVAIVSKPGKGLGKYENKLRKTFKTVKTDPDIVFVLGGDGTMFLSEQKYPGVPKFGLSKGRIAFLMQEKCEKVDRCLKKIEKGDFIVEERIALECEVGRAMNEIAILSPKLGKMIEPAIEIKKEKIPIRGDGIIFATQIGSTAYSLAAGGPVLCPGVEGYTMVPVNSQKRLPSLILNSDEKVKIKGDFLVVVDGLLEKRRRSLTVKVSKEPVRLVRIKDDFYSRLFSKLSAGII
jgi:NAD+ kinase